MLHENLKTQLDEHIRTDGDFRELAKFLECRCAQLTGDPVLQVENMLRLAESARYMRLQTIADKMAISPRSLTLRLHRNGTTFVQLRDKVLKERCLQLMESGTTSATALASTLGYSNPAYFYLIFKRWMGVNFKDYK